MKLRFRKNNLRLRVNQHEVQLLAAGSALEERVYFPGGAQLIYVLQPISAFSPEVSFHDETIRICAPLEQVVNWAGTKDVGLYFELPAGKEDLKIAIEKDLVCLDGAEEERDPDAFLRTETVSSSC